jgi:UDP-3-O-[3-hydroxymyristoyl] glucosamine N-acyltransferase
MNKVNLAELASLVDGRVVGDDTLEIEGFAPFDAAKPGDITFITNSKYLKKIAESRASAIIVQAEIAAPCALIVCSNPYLAFAKVLERLYVKPVKPQGILPGALIHATAKVGANVTIYPGCHVGENVVIGDGTTLMPNVVIYRDVAVGKGCTFHAGVVVREECLIGNRVLLQPSVVIGSDGFGFAPDGERYVKIPQIGNVIVEDDVEIGAGSCIDRAALGSTLIRSGSKLDNLVHIAHNVSLGENTVLAAQVGIAGSTKIGRHCTFGGQVGVAGHVSVGDNTTAGGKSGITSNTVGNQILSGIPAMPHRDWLKVSMSLAKLPQMRQNLNSLNQRIDVLEHKSKEDE